MTRAELKQRIAAVQSMTEAQKRRGLAALDAGFRKHRAISSVMAKKGRGR